LIEEEKLMELGLTSKVVIVTGGASGIGTAIVEGFVEEGANVVIADLDLEGAQKVAKKAAGDTQRVLPVRTDVAKKSDVDNLVSTTLKRFGRIDVLVNDAGAASNVLLVDLDEKEWDRINNVNSKGIYLVTRAVVPHMIAAKSGKIVNISSMAGKEGIVGQTHYCASKAAVLLFTQALAKELAEHNINVNAICPGLVRTPLWEGLLPAMSNRIGLPGEEIYDRWVEQIPLKRSTVAADIANVALFLSSEISRNITGEAINVNGGLRMD
jgi:meso-butanediol dehydrogenase/(S,S)-butanediol dehydrogenase/diacetyl reductase